jgi:chromosome segregation ATPase
MAAMRVKLQQQEIDRLQTAATEGSAVLASERDRNRVLHERCRALEGCVQEYQSKLQHQQQEIEENQSKHRQLEGSVQAGMTRRPGQLRHK